jgi:hypothetical protein
MLRTSRINPKLSAVTYIFGQYDFNRAPMAPPGTRIIAHETPNRRSTWDPHVNTSGKAGAQIPQLPLGDDSSPGGDNAVCM